MKVRRHRSAPGQNTIGSQGRTGEEHGVVRGEHADLGPCLLDRPQVSFIRRQMVASFFDPDHVRDLDKPQKNFGRIAQSGDGELEDNDPDPDGRSDGLGEAHGHDVGAVPPSSENGRGKKKDGICPGALCVPSEFNRFRG